MLEVRKLTRYQGRRLRTAYVAYLGDYQGPPASTPAAARRACLEDDAEVLRGSYEPRFLRFGNHTLVILRKPYRPPAWEYTILGPDTPRTESGHLRPCPAGWYPSADEAERATRRHLAQLLMRPHEGYTAEEVVDPRDVEDHLRYYRWHVAYLAAQDRGLSDQACREAGFLHRSGHPLEEAVQLAAAGYTVLTAPPRLGENP